MPLAASMPAGKEEGGGGAEKDDRPVEVEVADGEEGPPVVGEIDEAGVRAGGLFELSERVAVGGENARGGCCC